MRKHVFALLILVTAATATAQINETEVWVGNLAVRDGNQLVISELRNLSDMHPGYDNQPAFFPDGRTLVYSSQAMEVDDTGLGVHAQLVDLTTGKATTLAEAKGFSPTPTTDGKQLMVLRQGRVFLHDLTGKEVRALTDTDTAGYYTPFDERVWAMFMNDKDRRIVIYDPRTKKMDTMATGASTAPYRIPKERAVTFVAQDGEKRVLRRLDLQKRQVTTVSTIAFPTGGHHTWTSRGTLLMASGPTIYEWNPAKPTEWTPVFRSQHADLQHITRIAISPAGDRIALVSVPSDEKVIRNTRSESNRWIAAHRADRVACLFTETGTLTHSSGFRLDGKTGIERSMEGIFSAGTHVNYVRTPRAIEISKSDPKAFEHGTWTGRWTSNTGIVDVKGTYAAVWRRTSSQATGAPSWQIDSEIYVPIECTGPGCSGR
jgi:ketosteroid isomerase-like protein